MRASQPAVPTATLLLIAAALAGFACLLYAPSWHYGFAGDDTLVVRDNAFTHQGLGAVPSILSHSLYFGAVPQNSGLYRPVAGVYFALAGAIVEGAPSGYHILQILLYGLSVAVVFMFLQRLDRQSLVVPALAALLFAAHPIHTEVVDNIKSADELLCLIFLLSSATSWLIYIDSGRSSWRSASIALYALAVGSKETAVPMLVILPALAFVFRRRSARLSLRQAWPFLAVGIAFLIARQVVFAREGPPIPVTVANNALMASGDELTRLASAFAYLAKYASLLVWPHPLSFDYSFTAIPLRTFASPEAWGGIVITAGVIAVSVWGLSRRQAEGFSALWIAASMVAVSNVFFLVSTTIGERLLFLPSVMCCYEACRLLCRGAAVRDVRPFAVSWRTAAVAAVVLGASVAGSIVALRRTAEWVDERTLFTADVAKYPNSARLNSFLGSILYYAGDRLISTGGAGDEATADFAASRSYLLRSLEIQPEFRDVHGVLGMAEYQLHEYSAAVPHLEQAERFTLYRTLALEMLADSYDHLQMHDKAVVTYAQADREGIRYPHGWFVLGADAAGRGDNAAAIRYFSLVAEETPTSVDAFVNLALLKSRTGDLAGSLDAAQHCLALDPSQAKCLVAAGDDLLRQGHPDQAAPYFDRAKAVIRR